MNILFITYSRIGDAVLSTGILRSLIESHPQAEFSIACGPAAAPLFDATPRVRRLIVMTKRRWSMHWWTLWRICLSTRWDLIVDLRNSPVSRLLRAQRRRVLGPRHGDLHQVPRLAEVLNIAPPPAPRLWINEVHEARARSAVSTPGPVLALGPTANWRGKQWDPVRFAEVAHDLTGPRGILPGAKVAVFGADSERDGAEITLRQIPAPQRIDLVGRVDLLTAYSILRRCSLFIGNDSGLMHMAAAAMVPTLGLFGPSRDKHYAPWGSHTAAVRTTESYDQLINRPGYDHRTTGSLMGSLTVAAVRDAAVSLWYRSGGAAA